MASIMVNVVLVLVNNFILGRVEALAEGWKALFP